MAKRILGLLLLMAPVVEAAEPVGLLSFVSGNVQIVRAGETAPVAARTADLIGPGDRVMTGTNSEAGFLYCPQSRAAKMSAGSEVQFDSAALAVRKGKLSEERQVPTCRLPSSLALAAASKLQAGNLRLRGSNLLMRSPSHTNITTLLPRFRWEPIENATSYEVKLLDREENILWKAAVSSTEVQYPADAMALTWGQKYWWRVTARQGEETLTEAGSYFQVLPADQASQVRSDEATLERLRALNHDDNSALFLLAFLYEDNGMLDEAVRIYGELAQRMGPQDWVQGRLNDLMGKLGWDRLEFGPPK